MQVSGKPVDVSVAAFLQALDPVARWLLIEMTAAVVPASPRTSRWCHCVRPACPGRHPCKRDGCVRPPRSSIPSRLPRIHRMVQIGQPDQLWHGRSGQGCVGALEAQGLDTFRGHVLHAVTHAATDIEKAGGMVTL